MADLERLLIRLPNWLGDALLARPLLHALCRRLPDAEVRVVGPEPLLALLEGEPWAARADAWPADRGGRRRLVDSLRGWRPGAALVLPPSFSSAWLAWRSRAVQRIGYRGDWRDGLLTHALARPARGEMHLAEEYRALGRMLAPIEGEAPPLAASPAALAKATALRERAGLGGGRYGILGPGAIYGPAKRWSAERFAAVGRILADHGLVVAVCGTAAEREACQAVARATGAGAVSLAGQTDLATQAALCAGAVVAACNDSGLAHLSAAVGAPTVVIFGSTSSAWTRPLGPRVRVIQRAPVCAPCFQRTCRVGYRCLAAVEAGEVAEACLEMAA